MYILKCDLCGYEQIVKKRIDKDIYYELKHCKQLKCNRNKCREENDYSVPKGYIEHCLIFGNWSTVVTPTIEEWKSLKRAKEIQELGKTKLKKHF